MINSRSKYLLMEARFRKILKYPAIVIFVVINILYIYDMYSNNKFDYIVVYDEESFNKISIIESSLENNYTPITIAEYKYENYKDRISIIVLEARVGDRKKIFEKLNVPYDKLGELKCELLYLENDTNIKGIAVLPIEGAMSVANCIHKLLKRDTN